MERYQTLKELMRSKRSVMVAFSGGVDSTVVALAAIEALGGRCALVMVDNGAIPGGEIENAERTALEMGSSIRVVEVPVLDIPEIVSNPHDRCGLCKERMMSILIDIASKEGFQVVADGSSPDDAGDHRPGLIVSTNIGIWHPLMEANIGKDLARSILREKNISTHEKPYTTCLMTRIPYGERITREKLELIDLIEGRVRDIGSRDVRLRLFERFGGGYIGVLEVDGPERVIAHWGGICKGITGVKLALDPAGYRQGSLNAGLVPP
ncbi:MAG: ATP-dependent sacrificial sulfur transferase LarE [Candidatus Thermoplasmatota archaeon]|nr:ATP-dependent sacrificial sulfur transferase LarE [Candidatus Thermoplasmatota archaeon]